MKQVLSFCLMLLLGMSARGENVRTATTTWEQIVLGCDFVGVAECIYTGEGIATFKVLDCWKGRTNGTLVFTFGPGRFFVPGERQLLALQAQTGVVGSPHLLEAMFGTDINPLVWRSYPQVNYRLPDIQGAANPASRASICYNFSADYDLAGFKLAVARLLALTPDQQELTKLKALADKYVFGCDPAIGQRPQLTPSGEQQRQAILQAESVAQFLPLLLKSREGCIYKLRIIEEGGGARTIEFLRDNPPATLLLAPSTRDLLVARIERRIAGQAKPVAPAAAELQQMRDSLAAGPSLRNYRYWYNLVRLNDYDPAAVRAHLDTLSDRFLTTSLEDGPNLYLFETLTIYRPGLVAAYLCAKPPPQRTFELASYFCCRCGVDRKRFLPMLLTSPDPWVKTAAAVYLYFENREQSIRYLADMTKFNGDPGVWAAVTLARRGDKNAMRRALQVFTAPCQPEDEVVHRLLQRRVLALLVNSCRYSGVALPTFDQKWRTKIIPWWRSHADKITLVDPWLPTLDSRKCD